MKEQYQPSEEEIKKAEEMMTEEENKLTKERIIKYENNAQEGFNILSKDLNIGPEISKGLPETARRVKYIDLRRLREFPELRNDLVDEILERDKFEIIFEDGRGIASRIYGDPYDTGGEIRFFNKEQVERVFKLREKFDSISAEIKHIFKGREYSVLNDSEKEKVNDLNNQIRKIKDEYEDVEIEAEELRDRSIARDIIKNNKVAKAKGITQSGRQIEVDGDVGRLDFGINGSSDFARGVLGMHSDSDGRWTWTNKITLKDIDKTLFAFGTDAIDENGRERSWINEIGK